MFRQKLLATFIGIIIAFPVIEIPLRILTTFPKRTEVTNTRPHTELLYVMDSRWPDIDPSGFRNGADRERSDIVTLGDSMTYGYNATMEESWPFRLGKMAGKTVYNYGIGGYGTLQQYHALKEGLKKQPSHVILAVFLSNDIMDVCNFIGNRLPSWDQWFRLRGFDKSPCWKDETPPEADAGTRQQDISLVDSLKVLLKKSALVGVVDFFFWDPYKNRKSRKSGDGNMVIDGGHQELFFRKTTLDMMIKATDVSDPRVAFAKEATKDLVREMRDAAAAADAKFGVIIIPTQASVVVEYLQGRRVETTPEFKKVLVQEEALEAEFVRFFKEHDINFTIARDTLRSLMDGTEPVYTTGDDNHPLPIGYDAIAGKAYEAFFRQTTKG